jgi:thioredoxin 2
MESSAASLVVKCPRCGANNRVKFSKALEQQPVCGKCKSSLPVGGQPVTVTDSNFGDVVEKSSLPVLLDMWAAWCGPCRMVAPTIDTLAKELAGRVLVGKLDVDANPRTSARFGVQSIPTLLIIKNGREADRIVGVQTKEAIAQRLQRYL